jgi:eukaryotic-like serine/threonine-protein kinase
MVASSKSSYTEVGERLNQAYRRTLMNDSAETKPWQSEGPDTAQSDVLPQQFGRYRVERVLGQGGFGVVYLARDDQLNRPVAVKVAHRHRLIRPEDAQTYVAEARALANLDHPNIVPVHDVGWTEDGLPFIVSKYIEGLSLAKRIKECPPSVTETTELIATVAEALHYAHRKCLVHRDVKPANILLDTQGKPFLVDFGLALSEEDFGKAAAFAGTAPYMSPEQARSEGHRVDGRSDIFSLGVVCYELLTGRLPFRADTREQLLERIATAEPRPPRQINDAIPKELERICLKALGKRAAERYTTARDFADDLRHFAQESTKEPGAGLQPWAPIAGALTAAQALPSIAAPLPSSASDQRPIRIIPKGLRSFDANDADFFLELLPGPRDRDGLPDSIRFWKTKIEETDPDKTFSVGLIYGPSGCGKSSLVKAGLLPRLANHVVAVYVEATAEETENRLLRGLRKFCPDLPGDVGLVETLTLLRRGRFLPGRKKVLLILDQFEQWLHAKREQENTELVKALRQCDGARVQCLVMVRDDFWLAVSRFMAQLEVKLLQDHNIALVDLFDQRHARKVLAAFGRAFGIASDGPEGFSKEQKAFLDQAVAGLAQEGKIVSVRLALFAEMVKGKPWVPATLKEVGGMEGVGVAFLEETFAASTAQPQHRVHQRAAQAVLKALLPETGTDIKGNMRSYAELLEVSGYAGRAGDFDDLVRILDSELRLITPTDPEGKPEGERTNDGSGNRPATPGAAVVVHDPSSPRYYQLTHDYLVPSLRDWLTRQQKETAQGRAELRLAERATEWNGRPENRHLPAWWEWANIRLATRKRNWTPAQQRMMGRATGYHVVRGAMLASCLLLLALVGWEIRGRWQAHILRDRLLESVTADVQKIVNDMAPYRRWLNPLLRETIALTGNSDHRKRLHASLALLPEDTGQVDYLYGRLLQADAQEFAVIRDALSKHRHDLVGRLWGVLDNRKMDPEQRFRAACALAEYDGTNARWGKASVDVAAWLVTENSLVIGKWTDALRRAKDFLFEPLAVILEDERKSDSERKVAASIYADYAGDSARAFAPLERRLAQEARADAREEIRNAVAQKRANVGVALFRMGQYERLRSLLRASPEPTARSYLIHRLAVARVDASLLVARLETEDDVTIRRALTLSLGEFDLDQLPQGNAEAWLVRLLQLYRDDADPGIHGALDWLLRRWRQADKLKELDRELMTGKVEGGRQWYLNRQGQTMMVVPQPGRFLMGDGEERRTWQIGRSYAIASKEVTVEQFLRFRPGHKFAEDFAPTSDCPINNVTWYEAAAYCNWLSEQEKIPPDQWCYLPNDKGQYADGMKLAPGCLDRTGYRLPTDGEWEYACRAGSATPFFFGEPDELADHYAWHLRNANDKSHPAGTRKPNDLGLFDMHGNAWEWCQGIYKRLEEGRGDKPWADTEDVSVLNEKTNRMLRGGSFGHPAVSLRSADRNSFPPGKQRFANAGFRPARTIR